MRQLLRRAWYLIRRRRFDEDLREELDFHRASIERELWESGTESAEARFAARRAIGSVALAQDHARDVWVPQALQGLGQDIRLAFRSLRATPIVTTAAILSLALGIGANTAVFSLANSLLLRVLPVAEPQRLAIVSVPPIPGSTQGFSYATFREMRRYGGRIFDGALGYTECCGPAAVTIGGENQALARQFVTDDFFATLGVPAFRGRLLASGDDDPSRPDGPVAVISYRAWQGHFGGRDDLIGSPLTIDGVPTTIVGVTPPDFFGLDVGRAFDLAIPQHLASALTKTPFDEDTTWLNIMVRLKPGVSIAAATATIHGVQSLIRAGSMPKQPLLAARWLADPLTLEPAGTGTSALRQRFETPLLTMFAVVVVVLLIACANIANLLLARGVARRHELSVRVALGASRWRLARQLLAESLLLSALGAAIGLLLALWASRAIVTYLSTTTKPVLLDLAPDWRVLAFTVGAAVATAILFGMAPARRATRVAPIEALTAQGRGPSGGGGTAMASGLIVAQVALSLLLVFVAGLFVQTFERLSRLSLGFDRDHVLVITVNAHAIPFADRIAAFHRLVEAAAAVPGVVAAGGSLDPPIISHLTGDLVVSAPGTPPGPDASRISYMNSITPGWLAAYHTPILVGRDIDTLDAAAAPRVMLVNQAFVRQLFPGEAVVGNALAVTLRGPGGDYLWGTKTIVGIVADTVQRSLREPAEPMIYVPLAQRADLAIPQSDLFVALRVSTGSPVRVAHSAAAALTAVNREITLAVEPLAEHVDESLTIERVTAALSGFVGGLALLLAVIGLYGVTAYTTTRRRAEIGIRMALGASAASVARLILARVAILVTIGVAAGAMASMWLGRYVAALLYGVKPRDPDTLFGAAVVLATVAALAGWIPAWRASRIDPASVLRNE